MRFQSLKFEIVLFSAILLNKCFIYQHGSKRAKLQAKSSTAYYKALSKLLEPFSFGKPQPKSS